MMRCNGNGNGSSRQPHHRSHQSMESYSDAAAAAAAAAAASCKTDQLLERRKAAAAAAAVASDSATAGGQRSDIVAVLAAKDTAAFNLRCLWVGWVFMCWVGGMMTAAGFLLPYWLKGSREASDVRKQLSDLGLFRLCAYPRQVDGQVRLVMDCAHYRHFAEIPSSLWKLAFVLMATACCLLLLLTFFLAFTGFRLFILRIRSVVTICGVAQGFSSLFVLLSCLLYPAGWRGNPDVAQVCGSEADAFNLGHCHLGWAYVLTCAGGFLCAVTVAFPVQIAKHFPEESPIALAAAEAAAARQQQYQQQQQQQQQEQQQRQRLYQYSQQSLLHHAASPGHGSLNGTGRYSYVAYHSLLSPSHHQYQQQQQQQQLSRPPSVCTCATAADNHPVSAAAAVASTAAAAASETTPPPLDEVDDCGVGHCGYSALLNVEADDASAPSAKAAVQSAI